MAVKKYRRTDNQRAGPAFDERRKGRLEFVFATHFRDRQLAPEHACRHEDFAQHLLAHHGTCIRKVSDRCCLRNQLAQEIESLCHQLGVVKVTTVTLPPGRLRLATRPTRTGSAPMARTMGIVEVAACAACAEGTPPVAAITAT